MHNMKSMELIIISLPRINRFDSVFFCDQPEIQKSCHKIDGTRRLIIIIIIELSIKKLSMTRQEKNEPKRLILGSWTGIVFDKI